MSLTVNIPVNTEADIATPIPIHEAPEATPVADYSNTASIKKSKKQWFGKSKKQWSKKSEKTKKAVSVEVKEVDYKPDIVESAEVKEVASKPEVMKEKYVEEKVLVTIEEIIGMVKHPNADKLWIATVQGYDVIVNPSSTWKNPDGSDIDPMSILGKKIVYFQIDSVMPETFAKEGFWNYLSNTYMGRKIISAKIRGVISQGMISDFETMHNLFPNIPFETLPLGHNLTNELGVVKFYSIYDPERPDYAGNFDPMKHKLRPSMKSVREFPTFLVKTDQPRLQNNIALIRGLEPDRQFTATIKYDGQSVQWFCKVVKTPNPTDPITAEPAATTEPNQTNPINQTTYVVESSGVCSRNLQVLLELDLEESLREKANNKYRDMNTKYNLFEKLEAYCVSNGRSLSIQTEMYGMAINNNRHKKTDVDLAVFDVYDINKGKYLSHAEVTQIAHVIGLPTVPVLEYNNVFYRDQPLISTKVADWVAIANEQRYTTEKNAKVQAEGIVVKTSDGKFPYVSFKVISPKYLIEHGI